MNPEPTPSRAIAESSGLKGYRWPASHLTRADMQKLTELRTLTGRSIAVLLHDAVSTLYALVRASDAASRSTGQASEQPASPCTEHEP
jgi:hypothetical protein